MEVDIITIGTVILTGIALYGTTGTRITRVETRLNEQIDQVETLLNNRIGRVETRILNALGQFPTEELDEGPPSGARRHGHHRRRT